VGLLNLLAQVPVWGGSPGVAVVRGRPSRKGRCAGMASELGDLPAGSHPADLSVQALLVTQGIRLRIAGGFLTQLEAARLWDGTAVPPGLKRRLMRCGQLAMLTARRTQLTRARAARTPDPATALGRCVRRLHASGQRPIGAWVLSTDDFWLAADSQCAPARGLVGLVPAPYQSGEMARDPALLARATHVRRLMVELAWRAPLSADDALSQWYQQEVWRRSRRLRRTGLSRSRANYSSRYGDMANTAFIPEGAVVKGWPERFHAARSLIDACNSWCAFPVKTSDVPRGHR